MGNMAQNENNQFQNKNRAVEHIPKPKSPQKIAHIGIAVHSVEESASFYEQQLGLELEGIETVESEQVRVAFLRIGETRFELLEPTAQTSPIAAFLDKKGAGIHHIALEVNDIEDRLKQLKNNGIKLINEQPKDGAHGAQIAFLHPQSTGGTLLELCQYGKAHGNVGEHGGGGSGGVVRGQEEG